MNQSFVMICIRGFVILLCHSSIARGHGIEVEAIPPRDTTRHYTGPMLFGNGLLPQNGNERFIVQLGKAVAPWKRPEEWKKLNSQLKSRPAFTCESIEGETIFERLGNIHLDYVPALAEQLASDPSAVESYENVFGIEARKAEEAALAQHDLKALDDVLYQYPFTKASVSAAYFLAMHFQRSGDYRLSAIYAKKAIQVSEVAGVWGYQPLLAILQGKNGLILKKPELVEGAFQSLEKARDKGHLKPDQLTVKKGEGEPVIVNSIENFKKVTQVAPLPSVDSFDVSSLFVEPLPPSAEWYWRGIRLLGEDAFKELGDNGSYHFRVACTVIQVEGLSDRMRDFDRNELTDHLFELLGPEMFQTKPVPLVTKAFFRQLEKRSLSMPTPIDDASFKIARWLDKEGAFLLPMIEKEISQQTSHDNHGRDFDAIEEYGPKAERSVDAVLDYLKKEDSPLRWHAYSALGAIGKKPEKCIPELLKGLKDSDPTAKEVVAVALSHFAPASSEVLLKELRTPSQLTVDDVLYALGAAYFGNTEGILAELIKQMNQAEPSKKARFALAIGQTDINSAGLEKTLLDAFRNPETPDGLFEKLGTLLKVRASLHPFSIKPLLQEFEATPVMKRGNLAIALSYIGSRDGEVVASIARTVAEMAEDRQESQDFVEAQQALFECGSHYNVALPILYKARLNTKSQKTSERLKRIIEKIKGD